MNEVPHASGTFEATTAPEGDPETADGISVGRWTVDKRFTGGLEATSVVKMQGAGTADGSARAYVALERVTGTLDGRRGTFLLTHVGSMTPGVQPQLAVAVAPGLSTGELVGLEGTMTITFAGADHRYDLDYTLGS